MPQQTEVVAALTFGYTDQIDPQRMMVFHSMAHIEPKGVDPYIHNGLIGVPSRCRRLEGRKNIGIGATEHAVILAGSR